MNSKDHEILQRIKDISRIVINDEENHDLSQKKKVRIIDPLVLIRNAKMKKATELSTKIIKLNKQALEKSLKGTFVRVLNP